MIRKVIKYAEPKWQDDHCTYRYQLIGNEIFLRNLPREVVKILVNLVVIVCNHIQSVVTCYYED